MGVLLQKIGKYDLSPKTMCQLFDAFVVSTLNCQCEVWRHTKSKQLERLHLKFYKKILNVKLSTSSAGDTASLDAIHYTYAALPE